MKKILLIIAIFLAGSVKADEGMWMLSLIGKNYKEMKAKGLKLKPDDIYNINGSSLKDAVCTMNSGSCTAEMISSEGLLLTNHHCGYGAIQEFSSEENDYLTDGFWAMSREQEIHVPNMTMTFLIRMEDVSAQVLEGITDETDENERIALIEKRKAEIAAKAIEGTHYKAYVRDFFYGNEYYLFVNEVFTDIRMVGAPPSSVGKYGGDTDNWMWPRHTGDFTMFRIYAGKDNKPAAYSKDNKPFNPRHHLKVNIGGVAEGDFAMIMGYPGSTDRFLTSYGVKLAIEKDQPARVKIRAKKLDLMKKYMDESDKVRIQYASKYAQVSNYWKYFIGQTAQLKNNNVYELKKNLEDKFHKWAIADPTRKAMYGDVVDAIADAYRQKNDYWQGSTYINEAVFGPEINLFYWTKLRGINARLEASEDGKLDEETQQALIKDAKDFYKDFHAPLDKEIYAAMLKMYVEDVPVKLQPDYLIEINEKYNGNFEKFAEEVFAASKFTSFEKFKAALPTLTKEQIEEDKGWKLMSSFIEAYRGKIIPMSAANEAQLDIAMRKFVDGLRKMNPEELYAPNANSTVRLTYGNVYSYKAADAVKYGYYTTLDGLMAKKDNSNPEFVVPEKLETLYKNKDYGQYAINGELRVCFLTNNDITGGNSGSPVINGHGELIGCAFDGNWEAMSGDIDFEENLQRTICVSASYILFIIDKYAGATHLIEEIDIVTEPKHSKQAKKILKAKKKAGLMPY